VPHRRRIEFVVPLVASVVVTRDNRTQRENQRHLSAFVLVCTSIRPTPRATGTHRTIPFRNQRIGLGSGSAQIRPAQTLRRQIGVDQQPPSQFAASGASGQPPLFFPPGQSPLSPSRAPAVPACRQAAQSAEQRQALTGSRGPIGAISSIPPAAADYEARFSGQRPLEFGRLKSRFAGVSRNFNRRNSLG